MYPYLPLCDTVNNKAIYIIIAGLERMDGVTSILKCAHLPKKLEFPKGLVENTTWPGFRATPARKLRPRYVFHRI